MTVAGKVDEAADSDAVEGAGRLGLATRGVMYLISASLTVRIALSGSSDEGPGKKGALKEVADQPFGRIGLGLLAAGLAGYAVWRFFAAATYTGDNDDSAAKVWVKRLGLVGRGIIYVFAFLTAGSLIMGGQGGSEGGETARVFELPGGRLIVLGVGVGLLAAAAYNGHRAIGGSYKKKWSGEISERQRRWATVVSSTGLIGHMVVFALTGFFLVKAALEFDSSEPESLDEAVRALAETPGGTIYLLMVAFGMLAYAGFSFVEARWREIIE